MKKTLAFLLLVVLALGLTACQEVEAEKIVESPAPTVEPTVEPTATPEPIKYVVNSGDAWGDYGYVHFLCEQTGTYSFTAVDSEGIDWKVYILDAEFNDAERFIPHANECALEGDGTLQVNQGQYIYIYSTANCWTGIEAKDEAHMECVLAG